MNDAGACNGIVLRGASPGEPSLATLREVYHEAFPPEERRPWSDIERRIADDAQPLRMLLIESGGMVAGFVTMWRLASQLAYIEHLVIDPSFRGKGIGSAVIAELVRLAGSPIVLEAELPDAGDMARRRICFYRRNGFVANDRLRYVQPPYGPGLDEVPLMLMTYGTVDLDEAARCIHREVYGCTDNG